MDTLIEPALNQIIANVAARSTPATGRRSDGGAPADGVSDRHRAPGRAGPATVRTRSGSFAAAPSTSGRTWWRSTCGAPGTAPIVVLHDQSLERLWGRRTPRWATWTWAEVARSSGEGGVRIPTLAAGARGRAGALDGRLHPARGGAGRARSGARRRCPRAARSSSRATWRRCASCAPFRARPASGSRGPTERNRRSGFYAELRAEYWNPWFGLLSEAGAAAVHEAGRLVSTWTVDEAPDMERVVACGADAVVSNQVGALVDFVRS